MLKPYIGAFLLKRVATIIEDIYTMLNSKSGAHYVLACGIIYFLRKILPYSRFSGIDFESASHMGEIFALIKNYRVIFIDYLYSFIPFIIYLTQFSLMLHLAKMNSVLRLTTEPLNHKK